MKEVAAAYRAAMAWLRIKLMSRRTAYQMVFGGPSPHQRAVLEDLARFCRAHESTYHPDPRMHAVLEGRREVWLRIKKHIELDEETFWSLYAKEGK